MGPFDLANLRLLMDATQGSPDVAIGLIDGPVALHSLGGASGRVRPLSADVGAACTRASSTACVHGTFVAALLFADRGAVAPGICPGCTLLVRPIFRESARGGLSVPSATPDELAAAMIECIDAGARVLNLSLGLDATSAADERALRQVFDHAARRGVIVVAAAGNQRSVGSSLITGHPWVIPVVACNRRGAPLEYSNLGRSIGRRGLSAPGQDVAALGPAGNLLTFSGTSVAAPFVTAAIALMWSMQPDAPAPRVKQAIETAHASARHSVTPPMLDAWRAYQQLERNARRARQPEAVSPPAVRPATRGMPAVVRPMRGANADA